MNDLSHKLNELFGHLSQVAEGLGLACHVVEEVLRLLKKARGFISGVTVGLNAGGIHDCQRCLGLLGIRGIGLLHGIRRQFVVLDGAVGLINHHGHQRPALLHRFAFGSDVCQLHLVVKCIDGIA